MPEVRIDVAIHCDTTPGSEHNYEDICRFIDVHSPDIAGYIYTELRIAMINWIIQKTLTETANFW